jgi:hypothetical protein
VKKCASCTKDLPEAALHCVFCGAKQPPTPAVQPGMAKTSFGYAANDMQEQLRQSAAQQGRTAPPVPTQPAPGFPPSAFAPQRQAAPPSHQPLALQPTMFPTQAPAAPPPPRSAAPMAMAPTQAVQPYPGPGPSQGGPGPGPSQGGPGPGHGLGRPGPGPQPMQPPQPPQLQPQPGFVPASAASAKTMFVPGTPGPAPQGSFGPGQASPMMSPTIVPGPLQPMPLPPRPMQAPVMPQPPMVPPMPQPVARPQPMPIPAAQPPPYHSSQSFVQARRPIDPWRDSLRAMMFIWGVLLLGAFATPFTTSPLSFSWTLILDGAGTARLPPLVIAAVGLLSVVVAVIPMATVPRGVIAAVLGLAGVVVPLALRDVPPWQALLAIAGTLMLIPGLLIRSEYRGSLLPRVLVTLGALALLVPVLLPEQGAIPLVSLFKALLDVPGSAKVGPALGVGFVVIVVLSLLFTWVPAPVTGGARLWAWLVILWSLFTHVAALLLGGGEAISGSPHVALVAWIYGGASPMGVALGAAYLVLIGYGLAAVFSKQLE